MAKPGPSTRYRSLRINSAPKERRLAGLMGFEPTTFRVTGGRSNQTEPQPQHNLLDKTITHLLLNKKRAWRSCGAAKPGSSDRTRTCDLTINSRVLYQLSYRGTIVLINFKVLAFIDLGMLKNAPDSIEN